MESLPDPDPLDSSGNEDLAIHSIFSSVQMHLARAQTFQFKLLVGFVQLLKLLVKLY